MLKDHLLKELATLGLNLARLKCLTLLLTSLLRHRTVNLAISIVWKLLPQTTKRGNSKTKHRIALLKKTLKLMTAEDIFVLTIDREFGGKEWLQWFEDQGVGYAVRMKSNTVVGRKLASEHRTTRQIKSKAQCRQKVWDMDLFFASKMIQSKGKRDDRLYVISNRFSGEEALEVYQLR